MPPKPPRIPSQSRRSPKREIWPTSVTFQPIVPADRTQARCYMLEQRGPTLSVTFAPFTLPSVGNRGWVDDFLPGVDDDSDDNEVKPDWQDSKAPPQETKPTASPSEPPTDCPGNHHPHRMGYSGNPLAYPSSVPSAFATLPMFPPADPPNLGTSRRNSNNTTRRSQVRPNPARGQDAGTSTLLRGEHLAQSRRNGGENRVVLKRSVMVDLTSDSEGKDGGVDLPPRPDRGPTADASSSHNHSSAFTLNGSPNSSSASGPTVARERQPDSSPPQAHPPRTSLLSYDEAMNLSRPVPPQWLPEQGLRDSECPFNELPQGVPPHAQTARAIHAEAQSQRPLVLGPSARGPEAVSDLSPRQIHPVRENIRGEGISSLLRDVGWGRHGYDVPTFPSRHENDRGATSFTGRFQNGPGSPYSFTAAKARDKSGHWPSLTDRAGTPRRPEANKRCSAVSKAKKRAAPSCRDNGPGLKSGRKGDDDEDDDSDDNDALGNLSRFRNSGNGNGNGRQKARQSDGHRGVDKSSGPSRGAQGEKTRPGTATQGGDNRVAKKAAVPPAAQRVTRLEGVPTMARGCSASEEAARVKAEKSADEFQAIQAMIQLSGSGGAPKEISDAPLGTQRPQTLSSSHQHADSHMDQIRGVTSFPRVELMDRASHNEDGGPERKLISLESLEKKSQHSQLRKRKKELSGSTGEDSEQPLSQRLRLGTDNDKTGNERRKDSNAGKEGREEDEDDDLIFVGVRSAHDGAEEYTPRTLPPGTLIEASPTDQKSLKRVRFAAEPEAQRSKPGPSAKPSTTENVHYTLSDIPRRQWRVFTMGVDPSRPVGNTCFLLDRARRSWGVGQMELPLKVRQAIYRHLLVAEAPIEVLGGWSEVRRGQGLALHPALLRTCVRIHNEATALLYSENVFTYVLRDEGRRAALGRSQPWQLTLPRQRHAHHFRTLELHLQRDGDEMAYNHAIYMALRTLNLVGFHSLQKLTIVVRPRIDLRADLRVANCVAIGSHFTPDNVVIQALKDLQTDLIQIDLHLPETNAEPKKSIRIVVNKRIEVDQAEILREMDRQSGDEVWLGQEARRRLAEAELIRKSKAATDEQLKGLGYRIQYASIHGAACVLQRGWFTEFESDFHSS